MGIFRRNRRKALLKFMGSENNIVAPGLAQRETLEHVIESGQKVMKYAVSPDEVKRMNGNHSLFERGAHELHGVRHSIHFCPFLGKTDGARGDIDARHLRPKFREQHRVPSIAATDVENPLAG